MKQRWVSGYVHCRLEVALLLGTLENIKHRTIPSAIYACGLRLTELLHLPAVDIDS